MFRQIKNIIIGTLLSYPQVFFSKSYILAIFIMLISFFFPQVGISGFIAAFSSLAIASLLRLNENSIKTGYYGYNALLVGLGLGSHYQLTTELAVIIVFAAFLTLLLHIAIDGVFQKYRLPSLSLPFVFALWIIELALRNNSILSISEHNIYALNTIFSYGGTDALKFFDLFNNQLLPLPIKYFFVSLGSIFFQETALAGFVIFVGLLLFSRIAATLAVFGFATAYLFMQFIGIDTTQLTPFFVGYNFILTTIAVAGFFLIPSFYSYIWSLVLIPLTVLITFGLSKLLEPWQLAIYSLPFNFIVISSLYILNYRTNLHKKLNLTIIQEFMPEKNLYSYRNYIKRFGDSLQKIHIMLPFWGKWTVWQGYNGKHTHRDDFRHALDFVITINNSTFRNNGDNLEDYYCYDKQVTSPGWGTIVKIIDGIDDNKIGDVDTLNNWGNSIVIKHAENLYSQLNHLKSGSFKVKEGDFVKQGQPLASVGNSGRSPQPHLHFQMQAYPFVGSFTIQYPIARYIKISENNKSLLSFSIPQENDEIENIAVNELFAHSFHFIPGQIIEVEAIQKGKKKIYEWEVLVNSLNQTYIYCITTNSVAYILNDGLSHYFTSFIGNKKSILYQFYKYCYHVEFAQLQNLTNYDSFPLHQVYNFLVLFMHDFIAPFFNFIVAKYQLSAHSTSAVAETQLNANVSNIFFNKTIKKTTATITLERNQISKIYINDKFNTKLHFNFKQRFE